MNEQLQYNLERYKECTLKLVENVGKDDFDALQQIIDEREDIINIIRGIQYTTEEFRGIADKLQLIMLNEKLKKIMNEKQNYIKLEIEKLSAGRQANKNYNKSFYNSSGVFSKKV